MRLAIIGTGIAGNATAYALSTCTPHEITVFDKEHRPGGHSATVDIDYNGERLAVDTGFIVYNELNYPLLTSLFDHLGVETEGSDMSFSVSANNGRFEWCGRTKNPVGGLFAQRSNFFSPGYLRMLFENDKLTIMARARKTDSVELNHGEDFLGVISADDPKGKSFTLQMAILDFDLEECFFAFSCFFLASFSFFCASKRCLP